MPRKSREISTTGVYHVMLRGIDRGDIFIDEQDCRKFINILRSLVVPTDRNGIPIPAACTIYAYCLMTNHVHLLVSDNGNGIGQVMKRIGIAYVSYFNKRHFRLGPLFHDRFRSEPVEDKHYFLTLVNYIHNNPVEAGMTLSPDTYKWSSWHEYAAPSPLPQAVCSTQFPFTHLNWDELKALVINNNHISADIVNIEKRRKTDTEALTLLSAICCPHEVASLRDLSKAERETIIANALAKGIGMRQLARLLRMDYKTIQRIKTKFEIDNFK